MESTEPIDPKSRSWNPFDQLADYTPAYDDSRSDIRVFVWSDAVAMFGAKAGVVLSQARYWLGTRRPADRPGDAPHRPRSRYRLRAANGSALPGFYWQCSNLRLVRETGIGSIRTLTRIIHDLKQRETITTVQRGNLRYIGRGTAWDEWAHGPQPPSTSRGVLFDPQAMRLCNGHVNDALLFSKICYWHGLGRNKKCRIRIWDSQQRPWLAKSWLELGAEVGLTADQAKKAGLRLEAAGLIVNRPRMFRGKRVSCIALNWRDLFQRWRIMAGVTAERVVISALPDRHIDPPHSQIGIIGSTSSHCNTKSNQKECQRQPDK